MLFLNLYKESASFIIMKINRKCCKSTSFAVNKLEGCIVLNEHNTAFARSGLLYVIGLSLGPPDS